MSILDETKVKLGGNEYRYAVLGIRNVSFSGEVHFYGYDIIWERPENVTTTGGQEIDFEIRKEGKRIGAFRYFYIPFMLNSYCVAVESRQVKLADGEELTFVFIHSGEEDLWLVLSAS